MCWHCMVLTLAMAAIKPGQRQRMLPCHESFGLFVHALCLLPQYSMIALQQSCYGRNQCADFVIVASDSL